MCGVKIPDPEYIKLLFSLHNDVFHVSDFITCKYYEFLQWNIQRMVISACTSYVCEVMCSYKCM